MASQTPYPIYDPDMRFSLPYILPDKETKRKYPPPSGAAAKETTSSRVARGRRQLYTLLYFNI